MALGERPFPTGGHDVRMVPLLQAVFSIRDRRCVTAYEIGKRAKALKRSVHADKTRGLTANRRHLAKLLYDAADYLAKLFTYARDRSSTPPNDTPSVEDYPDYYSRSFATAAGTDLDSLTQPPVLPLDGTGQNGDRGKGSSYGGNGNTPPPPPFCKNVTVWLHFS